MILSQMPCTLLQPLIYWLAGIVAGIYIELNPLILIIAILLLLILTVIKHFNAKILLVVIFLLGAYRIRIAEDLPDYHLERILRKHHRLKTEFTGRITSLQYKNKYRYLYKSKTMELAGFDVAGNIYLSTTEEITEGSIVKGKVELEEMEGVRNPGQYDRRFSYRVMGINGIGKSLSNLEIQAPAPTDIFFGLRNKIGKRFQERLGIMSGIAIAMISGNKSGINWQTREEIRKSGLSHLFAVSGLHVGIISVIFYSLLMLIFPYKITRVATIFLLVMYGFICQWTASVTRAVLMLGLYTFCRLLEKPVNFNQILLMSLGIITLIEPMQLFSPGLQLSFVATLVIINLAPLLEKKLYLLKDKLLLKLIKHLLEGLILAAAIILAIAPISLVHFGEFSANSLISIVPASFLFGIILPLAFTILILPWGWQPFVHSYQFLTGLFNKWLLFCHNLPFYWQNCRITTWQALSIYLLIGISYLGYRRKLKLLMVVGLLLIAGVVTFNRIEFKTDRDLKITCLDCGQGDLNYIEFPNRKNLVIDTGPEEKGYGTVDKSLIPWLKQKDVDHLDYLLITHAHNDHYGGMIEVLTELEVRNIIIGNMFISDLPDKELIYYIDQENSNIITLKDTMNMKIGDVTLQFLLPDEDFEPGNQNDKSIVLRLIYNDFEALFTGDIERDAEAWLVEKSGRNLHSDFLKVPHHGSNTSSTKDFISKINPVLAFIPAGKNNRFRLPHYPVLKRYKHLNDKLINGAEDGALLLSTDGFTLKAEAMLRDSVINLR